MIDASQMLPLLVEASPGFAGSWKEFEADCADDSQPSYYIVLGSFARHLCDLLATGDEAALRRVFAVVERLHIEGDSYVQEAATVGLLEDMQNTNMHRKDTLPEQFERFLLPESARWWKRLHGFWREGQTLVGD
jgi:hypothetical protein